MKKIVIIFFLMIISFSTINIDITVASTIDNLSCKSYVLVDTKTGKIIEGLNYNDRVEVASICKLMTVYITLNYIEKSNVELDTKIFASPYATSMEGSSAYLDNQEYSLDDLLKSVIVASANDSAVVLAEYVAGNEIEFVKLMNTTAKELGMFDTKYSNATGLSALEQYSTAHDTAILINELYKNELYLQYSTIWMDMITHLSGRQTSLVNTNRLIKYYNNVLCGKTGFTDEAGYCLASIATNNDITLTCVVLGCKNKQDRFNDSVNIFEEAFSDYYSEVLLDKSMPIDNNIKVNKGTKNVINLFVENSIEVIQSKNNPIKYYLKYNLPYSIKAPIYTDDIIGTIDLVENGVIIETYNIVSGDNIPKASYVDYIKDIVNRFGQNK